MRLAAILLLLIFALLSASATGPSIARSEMLHPIAAPLAAH
ncbi:hypothetical protein [Devosia elaeis]|jgi:hypothetical protein|nr:hypothetical protein [Devosia elaeis]